MQLKLIVPPRNEFKQIDNRWSQIKMSYPFSPRCAFGFCSHGEIGYLYGGYNIDEGTLGDMFTAKFNDSDDRNWYHLQQKGKQIPGKLKSHTLSSYLCYLICIGGQKHETEDNGNIFKFNLRNNYWSKVELSSENEQQLKINKELLAIDSHGCFLYKHYLYIFGGYLPSQGVHSNHTLRLSLDQIQTKNKIIVKQLIFQNNKQIPQPRRNFAYCVLNNEGFIFGGVNQYELFDDFWKFNFQTEKWKKIQLSGNSICWPEKRKGAVLVCHQQSQSLILFGGMQQVTKQLNDLSIYLTHQQKWVKIHSNTNNIYAPSPTLKHQIETSPTIINHRSKKVSKQQFKLGVKNIECDQYGNAQKKKLSKHNNIQTNTICPKYKSLSASKQKKLCISSQTNYHEKSLSKTRTPFAKHSQKTDTFLTISSTEAQKQGKVSIVKEKRHRKFLQRKKILLSKICTGSEIFGRSFSPTSQCLNYTLKKLGEQQKFQQLKNPEFVLPKVIFDNKKSEVIGKKPCARDGHSAFGFGQNMYIIGGDRHTVSFNDTHILRMDKAIQSLNYYA